MGSNPTEGTLWTGFFLCIFCFFISFGLWRRDRKLRFIVSTLGDRRGGVTAHRGGSVYVQRERGGWYCALRIASAVIVCGVTIHVSVSISLSTQAKATRACI